MMSDIPDIAAALRKAIASEQFPPKAVTHANHLLDRLEKPVRVALLGKPGTGKSTLRDLLAGGQVVPADRAMPTLELTYGDKIKTICTLADGSKTTLAGNDPDQIAALAPVFIQMQMPLPALTKISVLEVVAPDDLTAIARASQWAASRSDVVLWCSQNFDVTEQKIWAPMPEQIKDQAFLMITKTDILRAQDRLDAVLAQAAMVARDEFQQILNIAAVDAIAARNPDGSVDKQRLQDSGGLALIGAMLKQVEACKQSASDMAEFLLSQHPPETTNAAPEPAVPPAPAATNDRSVYRAALDHITAQCAQIVAQQQDSEAVEPAQVMAMISDQLQWLSDFLQTKGITTDDALRQMQDMALDAADMVQLMQMEKRDSAAIEAASLLLQVKHELEAQEAA